MGDSDKEKTPYETLGLPPDATLDQVKSRFRELNNAYLKILQLSKEPLFEFRVRQMSPKQESSQQQETPTGSITIKAIKKGEIQKAQFEKPPLELRIRQISPKQESSHPQETRTEPITKIKARFAKGEIQKAQFEKLAKERYNYLKNKSFTDLSDSEFEERLHGFEGLKFL